MDDRLESLSTDPPSLTPMLILGDLSAQPIRQLLQETQKLSGRPYHIVDHLDGTLLAIFNTSSLSCCIVVDIGDAKSAILRVKSAVADLPQTPLLLLTSRHTATLESQAIAAGADDCVGISGLTAPALTRIVGRTLQRADRRRRLLDAIPVPMLHATLQGTVHWTNGAFLTLFSCANLDQVRSLGLESLIVDFARRLNRAGASNHFSSQQIIAQQDGGQLDVVMMISCLNRLAPEEGVQVTFTDITELEHQRRQLDLAERRTRELYDHSPVMMYTLSVGAVVLDVNEHWLKEMAYGRADVIGAPATQFHDQSVDLSEESPLWQPLHSGADHASAELRLVTRTGQRIEGLAYATAARGPGGELIAARLSVLDLTNFKRAQSERDQMERELRLAQKLESVGQLAAGIAHEINTPAQFVGDNLAFLESTYQDLSPVFEHLRQSPDARINELLKTADAEFLLGEAPKAIAQAQDGIRRIRKIVLALKEFAHPGSEDKALADLNHVIENTVTLARGEWKHTAELKLELTENLPPVLCSASSIAQVVLNMIVNAAHAIADRPPTPDRRPATITIRTALDDHHFVISISDTGCGMTEEVQARMFDPFFTTKEVGRGSGQGLAIARSIIVDQHQGSITVDSTIDVGSTFTLRLPLGGSEE